MPRDLIPARKMHLIVNAIADQCTVFDDVRVTPRHLDKIGYKLYALNFVAVNLNTGTTTRIPAYAYAPPTYQADAKLCEQYRAVVDLMDVCASPDVRASGTFVALDAVRLRLALEIADAATNFIL